MTMNQQPNLTPEAKLALDRLLEMAIAQAKARCMEMEGNQVNWKAHIPHTSKGKFIRPEMIDSLP